jgi:predicted nucleic acid-binding protein
VIDAAVVDASVATKWLLDEADSDRALRLRNIRLFAPELLVLEVANVLWTHVRTGRLSAAQAVVGLSLLQGMDISWSSVRDLARPALDFAFQLDHAVYDSAYLALAEREVLPVVTADARFARAARRAGGRMPPVLLLSEIDEGSGEPPS